MKRYIWATWALHGLAVFALIFLALQGRLSWFLAVVGSLAVSAISRHYTREEPPA